VDPLQINRFVYHILIPICPNWYNPKVMKKIVIAGGTGFLGSCLIAHYKQADVEVVILTRRHVEDHDNVRYCKWDGRHLGYWTHELADCDVLINLNGKSVDCRYNEQNKQLIYDTRIEATHVLGQAVRNCKNPPKLWINSASATIYRHALDKEMDEATGEIGSGFSVDVCKKWEAVFHAFELPNTRKVVLRTGIVLGSQGGPLIPLRNLAKMGLGGKHGKGDQYFSWIHEKDFTAIIDFIARHTNIDGVINVTVPEPITNTALMKSLRESVKAAFGMPMPKWLLELGAVFIRTEAELILKSRRVVPARLLEAGFVFKYDHIDLALKDIQNSLN
jgi:uncharacterized protein (TIGR01777 family)